MGYLQFNAKEFAKLPKEDKNNFILFGFIANPLARNPSFTLNFNRGNTFSIRVVVAPSFLPWCSECLRGLGLTFLRRRRAYCQRENRAHY